MPIAARVHITVTILLGAAALLASTWQCDSWGRFAVYLVISIITASWKVRLPSIRGTLSANFLYVLLGIAELSSGETAAIGIASVLFQYLWKPKSKPKPVQALFNAANVITAVFAAYTVYHLPFLSKELMMDFPVRLSIAASIYFVANTLPVALIISLTEGKPAVKTWVDAYAWSFPHYLVGAAVTVGLKAANSVLGWQSALLIVPVIFLVYRTYSVYMERLESERKQAHTLRAHAEEMSSLHLRTIEALALAIEAKDEVTHDHLQRVKIYCMEIAQELGLTDVEKYALQAASLLHDIGKLAVPEHIISKPGKLTPEEFEKMKIHPVVGAEILERVKFPYPVVPIVRHHHEKWNGAGYPDGISGEAIPIGARILSAVDCLDALASDRQYRKALPIEKALEIVQGESGKSYDPRIVEILVRRHEELERKARAIPSEVIKLNKDIKVERGLAPGAGFEESAPQLPRRAEEGGCLNKIATATQEAQALFELSADHSNALSLAEMLALMGSRLKKLIPHDTFAVYLLRDGHLEPEYVEGEDKKLFTSLRIPLGQGLSGWVAENRMPVMNGNPAVEPGYMNDPRQVTRLRSALAAPLEGRRGVIGTLAFYGIEKDVFSKDHLRILQAVAAKIALSIENALRIQRPVESSDLDSLTGLPHSSTFYLELEREFEFAVTSKGEFGVVVCDLNGFREVNERCGRLAGDQALKTLASALAGAAGKNDLLARRGGDEFVLLCRDASVSETEDAVRRMQAAIAQTSIPGIPDGLGASMGFACYPADASEPEKLLSVADSKMYRLKPENRTHGSLTALIGAVAPSKTSNGNGSAGLEAASPISLPAPTSK
ncbi:MAG: diguanylate cyclase [Candidatus Solibacter usitatus]|nr:diguanylate cyclase [Candidatus Solibacter usitatus]